MRTSNFILFLAVVLFVPLLSGCCGMRHGCGADKAPSGCSGASECPYMKSHGKCGDGEKCEKAKCGHCMGESCGKSTTKTP